MSPLHPRRKLVVARYGTAIFFVLWFVLRVLSETDEFAFSDSVITLLAIAQISALACAIWLFYRARQYNSMIAMEATIRDGRRPILYLRRFDSDASPERLALKGILGYFHQYLYSGEEQLTRVLEEIGPVITAQNPADVLPHPGAIRVRLSNDAWRAWVQKHLHSCQLILFRGAISPSLDWELEQIHDLVPPQKLILWFDGISRQEYRDFHARYSKQFPQGLPHENMRFGVRKMLVVFNEDWSARVLSTEGPSFGEAIKLLFGSNVLMPDYQIYKRALYPVFRDLDVDWIPKPNTYTILLFATVFSAMAYLSWMIFMS